VTSTLDGHTTLPHRIHWQAFPSGPSFDVSEVDYLIDGKQLWVEHNAPYYYRDDGAGVPSDDDLNGWCNNAPGSPARYRWSVTGTHLRFTFAGGRPCPGFTQFLTATWVRVS
jgi:hypothetical protein